MCSYNYYIGLPELLLWVCNSGESSLLDIQGKLGIMSEILKRKGRLHGECSTTNSVSPAMLFVIPYLY